MRNILLISTTGLAVGKTLATDIQTHQCRRLGAEEDWTVATLFNRNHLKH